MDADAIGHLTSWKLIQYKQRYEIASLDFSKGQNECVLCGGEGQLSVIEEEGIAIFSFLFFIYFFLFKSFIHGAGRLQGDLRWLASARQQRGLDFLSDALFLINRLMLLAHITLQSRRGWCYGSIWVILDHSAVVTKKSGQPVPRLEGGTELLCPTASHQTTASPGRSCRVDSCRN